MSERCIIAIDPGVNGGFCQWIGKDVVQAWRFKSLSDFAEDVFEYVDHPDYSIELVLEDVPPFAGKNIPSSAGFKLGKSCGFYEGLARGLKIPCHLVPPKTWQKGLGGLQKKTTAQRKRLLKDHASRLYPSLGKQITLNTADSILIGDYHLNKYEQA